MLLLLSLLCNHRKNDRIFFLYLEFPFLFFCPKIDRDYPLRQNDDNLLNNKLLRIKYQKEYTKNKTGRMPKNDKLLILYSTTHCPTTLYFSYKIPLSLFNFISLHQQKIIAKLKKVFLFSNRTYYKTH